MTYSYEDGLRAIGQDLDDAMEGLTMQTNLNSDRIAELLTKVGEHETEINRLLGVFDMLLKQTANHPPNATGTVS